MRKSVMCLAFLSPGQVWVDAQTYDVLRIDRRLAGPVDVRVPPRPQRRYNFGTYVVLDRYEVTMRFRPVAFTDPDCSPKVSSRLPSCAADCSRTGERRRSAGTGDS